jgi:hypothetical protein
MIILCLVMIAVLSQVHESENNLKDPWRYIAKSTSGGHSQEMSTNAGSVTASQPRLQGSAHVRSRLWGLFVLAAVGAVAVGIWAGVRTDSSSAGRKSPIQSSGDRASAPVVTASALDAAQPQASATGSHKQFALILMRTLMYSRLLIC